MNEIKSNPETMLTYENFGMVERLDSFVLHLMHPGAVGYLCTEGDGIRIAVRVSRLMYCLDGTEKQTIQGILLLLGVPPQCTGFSYVAEAIVELRQNFDQSLTKELYWMLAKRHHRTVYQVEHAIRMAIASAWEQGDKLVWRMLFAAEPDGYVPKPTNGQFLFRIARLLDAWGVPQTETGADRPIK